VANFKQLFAGNDQAIIDAAGDDALLDGVPVRGFFEAPWLQPNIGTMRTGLREPMFTAPDNVVADAIKSSVLRFENIDYSVVNIEPDGTGMTALILRP